MECDKTRESTRNASHCRALEKYLNGKFIRRPPRLSPEKVSTALLEPAKQRVGAFPGATRQIAEGMTPSPRFWRAVLFLLLSVITALATWHIRSEMKRKSLDSDSSGSSQFRLGNGIQTKRVARSSIFTMRKPTSCSSHKQAGSPREAPRCTMYFFHAKSFFAYFFYADRRVIPR